MFLHFYIFSHSEIFKQKFICRKPPFQYSKRDAILSGIPGIVDIIKIYQTYKANLRGVAYNTKTMRTGHVNVINFCLRILDQTKNNIINIDSPSKYPRVLVCCNRSTKRARRCHPKGVINGSE